MGARRRVVRIGTQRFDRARQPGCPPVDMTAGGRTQPELLGGVQVLALVRRLLGPSVT